MLTKRDDETTMQFVQRQDAYQKILAKLLSNIRAVSGWSDQLATMEGQLWVVDGKTWTAESLGLTADETAEVAAVLRGGAILRKLIAKVADPAISTKEIEAFEAALAALGV